jgi:hypothetical protein
MHQSKLIELLKALSRKQIKRLDDFVQSPYYNTSKTVIALLQYCIKQYPQFSPRSCKPETIIAKIKIIGSENKLHKTATELLHLTEQFLAAELWMPTAAPHTETLRALKQMKLTKHFAGKRQQLHEQLNNADFADFDNYYLRHLLTEINLNGFDSKMQRNEKNDIQPVMQSLTLFYHAKTLRYLCEAANRKNIFNIDYNMAAAAETLNALHAYNTAQYPYIQIFSAVYQMLAAQPAATAVAHYHALKALLPASETHIHAVELNNIFGYAIAYCLRMGNAGNKNFYNEYLYWIEKKQQYNLLLEGGEILPVTYRNIVKLGLLFKPVEWVKQFMDSYERYLPAALRDYTLNYTRGLYYFELKQYKKAGEHFQKARSGGDVVLETMIRKMIMKCHYEVHPLDTYLLQHYNEAFRTFISGKQTLLGKHAAELQLFHKYFGLLVARQQKQHLLIKSFGQLQSEPFFSDKEWLQQKMQQIVKLQPA